MGTSKEDDKSIFEWRKYGKIAVYIDNANLIHSPQYLGWYISLKRLSDYFKTFSKKLITIKLFDSIPNTDNLEKLLLKRNPAFTQDDFVKYSKRAKQQRKLLEKAEKLWGYKVNLKDLRFIFDHKRKEYVTKGDCDVDLTVDAIRFRKEYETLVLLSGDGDYVPLLNYLRQCKKRIVVMSTRGLVANILIGSADEYLDFRKLRKFLILRLKRFQNHNTPPKRGIGLTSKK